MPATTSQPVSELLAQWRTGDEGSLRRLVPLVYDELRRLAHYQLRRGRPDHTLQTTALVHEAYLCLAKQEPTDVENRAHFFAVCAPLTRQMYTLRRDDAVVLAESRSVDLVALDDALNGLAKLDLQQSRIVEAAILCWPFDRGDFSRPGHLTGHREATLDDRKSLARPRNHKGRAS